MQPTLHQARTVFHGRAVGLCDAVGFGGAVVEAMCVELALAPAVRWPMVAEARARLERSGAPSDEALAGMLVAPPAG